MKFYLISRVFFVWAFFNFLARCDRIHGINRPKETLDPNTIIQCELCGKSYKRKYLKKHKDFVHEKKPQKKIDKSGICDVCGNFFNSVALHKLRNHTENENPISCESCGKTFINNFVLQDHQKTHVKIPCTICGMMVRSIIMKRHMQHKHMEDHEKPYR